MASAWFVQVMGEQIGPLSDDQLRKMVAQRQLVPDTLVRKGASAKWVLASKVRGLFEQIDIPVAAPTDLVRPQLIACPDCGKRISINAHSCTNCGRSFFRPNRNVAIALAWILGGIGAHKFYLRKPGEGIAAVLFCWSFIPTIFAIVEGFQYVSMDDESFTRKFGSFPDENLHSAGGAPRIGSKSNQPMWRWIVWIGASLFVVIIIRSITPDSDGGHGSDGVGRSSSGQSLRKNTAAATNQEVYSRMMDLAGAGDNSGVQRLMAAGLACTLAEGTEVRVIDLGIFTTEIKVESGPYAGDYFIVPTENIIR
jgi:TM2 domain-containing membrane protein YozV